MKIIFFSYYYIPDFCAGSFRAKGLIDALLKKHSVSSILLITTQPNRYGQTENRSKVSVSGKLTVVRIKVPEHNNVFYRQVFSYMVYLYNSLRLIISIKFSVDNILSTSSRTGTSFIGFLTAKMTGKTHFADIRDIFSDNLSSVLKENIVSKIFTKLLSRVESTIVKNARWVNFVSPGFLQFYPRVNAKKINVFTNGIDSVFIDAAGNIPTAVKKGRKNIVYAGNIGFGQGLEKIIPPIAEKFQNEFNFIVVGDGSSKKLLTTEISGKLNNVSLLAPMPRENLVELYKSADIFFFHLADIPAFRNVIPSKVFEYSVFNKPILAGISGVSRQFCEEHIPGTFIFSPENVAQAINQVEKIKLLEASDFQRQSFITEFSRKNIMNKMVESIISAA